MTTLELIIEAYPDSTFLKADGFDDAIIGVYNEKLVYSQNRVINLLMEQGMEEEEAIEYYYFNIVGAYMGEKTPLFVDDSWSLI